jgi:hypothetical protein
MTKKRKLITFDWAIKRLLRSKANFGILEGLLSELLKEDISINILYFDLGSCTDYIYKGTNGFIGLHDHDILELNAKQKQLFKKGSVESLYPEYYPIKINRFNDIAKDTLDEGIYFLKNEEIKQILQKSSE